MQILKAGELDWMIEINSITGYTDEVVNFRGRYLPVIDFRREIDLRVDCYRSEMLISVLKVHGQIFAFFVSAIPEAHC